jgi:Zn-dependent protease with chaperone function
MAGLPQQQQVRKLPAKLQRKLRLAHQALKLFDREAVFQIVIIDVRPALFALHARAVVLISRPALDILSAEQVGAMVAHEAAHEYLWSDFQRAREVLDLRALNRIEFTADAISIVRMHGTPMSGEALVSALRKIASFNERFGPATDEHRYPPLATRLNNAKAAISWAAKLPTPCPQ